jgi:hypothetical protein
MTPPRRLVEHDDASVRPLIIRYKPRPRTGASPRIANEAGETCAPFKRAAPSAVSRVRLTGDDAPTCDSIVALVRHDSKSSWRIEVVRVAG